MNWKGCGIFQDSILKFACRKIMKYFYQDSPPPDVDFNLGPLKYESAVLTTEQLSLVKQIHVKYFTRMRKIKPGEQPRHHHGAVYGAASLT